MKLGAKIELGRKKKDLTSADLSGVLNISEETLLRIERNEINPDEKLLKEISNVLDISYSYLISEPNSNIENKVNNSIIETNDNISNIETTKPIKKTYKTINKDKLTLIKVFLVIGAVLDPLALAAPFVRNSYNNYLLLFNLYYLVCIPLCVYSFKVLKKAEKREDLTAIGIIDLFFLSLVGGILILCLKDKDFIIETNIEKEGKKQKNEKKKKKEEINNNDICDKKGNQISFYDKAQELINDGIDDARYVYKKGSFEENEVLNKLDELKNKYAEINDLNTFNEFIKVYDEIMAGTKKKLVDKQNIETIILVSVFAFVSIGVIVCLLVTLL